MASSLPWSPPLLLPKELHRVTPFVVWPTPSSAVLWCLTRRRRSRSPSPRCSCRTETKFSWLDPDQGFAADGFGGWSIRTPETRDKNGLLKFLVAGVASSAAAILFAALTYCCWSKKGLVSRLASPFYTFGEKLMLVEPRKHLPGDSKTSESEIQQVSRSQLKEEAGVAQDELNPPKIANSLSGGKRQAMVQNVVDPAQQAALTLLKKLMIIDDDVSANELCTRREYARWLVKANCTLERNPKYRIVPKGLLSSSVIGAFDDVYFDDPDFWCIQSLAEVGIIPSKLSTADTKMFFSPESFISRIDVVNWKIILDCPVFSELDVKISRMNVGFTDLSTHPESSSQLLMDLMAGEKSIIRRTFGNIRRLQSNKPVTKAQAALILSSGRMAEAIHSELSRLEAENLLRLAEMEEIRSDLMRRGDIPGFWEKKLGSERVHALEAEKDLKVALLDLEQEKAAHEDGLVQYMEKKVALDSQQQLLQSLKEEVDGVYDKLAVEKSVCISEKHNLEGLCAELYSNQHAILEAKSTLEAEKEALRVLRYWVEEEALRMQTQRKALEQATRRWQYNMESFEANSNTCEQTQGSHGMKL